MRLCSCTRRMTAARLTLALPRAGEAPVEADAPGARRATTSATSSGAGRPPRTDRRRLDARSSNHTRHPLRKSIPAPSKRPLPRSARPSASCPLPSYRSVHYYHLVSGAALDEASGDWYELGGEPAVAAGVHTGYDEGEWRMARHAGRLRTRTLLLEGRRGTATLGATLWLVLLGSVFAGASPA